MVMALTVANLGVIAALAMQPGVTEFDDSAGCFGQQLGSMFTTEHTGASNCVPRWVALRTRPAGDLGLAVAVLPFLLGAGWSWWHSRSPFVVHVIVATLIAAAFLFWITFDLEFHLGRQEVHWAGRIIHRFVLALPLSWMLLAVVLLACRIAARFASPRQSS